MKIGPLNIPIKEDFSAGSIFGFEKNFANILVFLATIVMLGLIVMGIANYLIHGHHAYNVTREHPWGLLIAVYIFFVVVQLDFVLLAHLEMFLVSKDL